MVRLKPEPSEGSVAAGDIFRWALPFLKPHRRRIAILALLSTAEVGLRALSPWPLKAVVDELAAGGGRTIPLVSRVVAGPTEALFVLVLAGLCIQVGHELVLLFHSRRQARLAQKLVFDLRARVYTHLQYLALTHYEKFTTGDAMYRLERDTAAIESILLGALFPQVFSALTLVVMFAVLVRLDFVLALVAMVIVPFLYLLLRIHVTRSQPQTARARASESVMLGQLLESLAAIRLVKTFAREEYELGRFTSAAARAMGERFIVIRHASLFTFMVGAITAAGSATVLAVGGMHVLDGRLTVGTLLVVTAYLGFVYGPLSAIATTAGGLQEALVSLKRVRELLVVPREDQDDRDAITPPRFEGAVRFEDVTFEYRPGQVVLKHVNLEVRPGETIALVGPSGAGKTTLVTLLGRYYTPTSGRVLIDGRDVRRIRLKALREQIAIVLQDAIMFSGSIGDNILYGRLDATEHEAVLAARAADCEDFVAGLRRGFDTPVGGPGGGISGGQKQRVSIARAFLKDAPILILDEPTAALDTISEQALLRSVTNLRKGRTTFVIAHRLSTVRNADRIVVMKAGEIVAQGRHDDLLRTNELYQQLCRQLTEETDESPG